MVKMREKYLKEGKVENLVITEELLFSNSSAAADFVLGYSIGDPRTWKTKNNRSLEEIEDN